MALGCHESLTRNAPTDQRTIPLSGMPRPASQASFTHLHTQPHAMKIQRKIKSKCWLCYILFNILLVSTLHHLIASSYLHTFLVITIHYIYNLQHLQLSVRFAGWALVLCRAHLGHMPRLPCGECGEMLGSYASHVSPQVGQPRTQRQAAAEGLPKHPKKKITEFPKLRRKQNTEISGPSQLLQFYNKRSGIWEGMTELMRIRCLSPEVESLILKEMYIYI